MAYESFCAECTYMHEGSGPKYWCEKKNGDRYACDPKCDSFCKAYSRSESAKENMYERSLNALRDEGNSGCYITTIMCKVLNYKDDNEYLKTLRGFRDNYMKADKKYFPLLLIYDTFGRKIAENLEQDQDRLTIANTLFDNYIVKAVDLIKEGKNEDAVNIYTAMTASLAEKYHLVMHIDMPRMEDIDMKALGHGRKRTYSKPKEEFV